MMITDPIMKPTPEDDNKIYQDIANRYKSNVKMQKLVSDLRDLRNRNSDILSQDDYSDLSRIINELTWYDK